MSDFDSVHAELARVDARLKHLRDAMEPQYSVAIQEGDEPRMREIERLLNMGDNGEYAYLLNERGRITAALDWLRPGWENSN